VISFVLTNFRKQSSKQKKIIKQKEHEMNLSNLKDTLSTICAWITLAGGAVLAGVASGQISLPTSITTIIGSVVGFAVIITQFLTGKNADGTAKTPAQVAASNVTNPVPPETK
jgi:hypothetical protein